jgi:hypothetical protein
MFLTKLKGVALVFGSSVAMISGAVALGQTAPGTGPPSTSDSARMTAMERKLDRIIDALDRLTSTTSPNPTSGAGLPQPNSSAPRFSGLGQPETKSAPAVSYPSRDERRFFTQRDVPSPKGVVDSNSPTLADRVDAVERAIQDVQNHLKQLEKRVSQLESPDRGKQHGSDEGKRPF